MASDGSFTDDGPADLMAFQELISLDTTELKGGINYIEASISIMRAFDTDYGIDAGVSSVEMSDAERFTPGSLFDYWCMKFDDHKLGERFNISITDFIDLPSFMMESLCKSAEQSVDREAAISEDIRKSLSK